MENTLTIPVMWGAPPEPPADANYEGFEDGFVPTEAARRIAQLEMAIQVAMETARALNAWAVVAILQTTVEG